MDKWHRRFLDLAEHIAKYSKDPSTQVGAVIVDEQHRIISMGYNGFPKGVGDLLERLHDRQTKYEMVVHAEINALLFAKCPLDGLTLYTWPILTCSRCAGPVINAGITQVYAPNSIPDRWHDSIQLAMKMYREADVRCELIG